MIDEKQLLLKRKYELLKELNYDLYYPELNIRNRLSRFLIIAELETINKKLKALSDQ